MPVADDEKLIAYYHPPKDWWVVMHIGPGDKTIDLSPGLVVHNASTICHQARYETPMLIDQRQAQTGPG
jgi:hypothetical protein